MTSIRIALIAPLLSAVALAAAQNPLRDFVLTKDKAFGLLPARPVGGPGVSSMAWSTDGRYLLMVSSGTTVDGNLPGANLSLASFRKLANMEETSLSLYDAQTGKSQTLWSAPRRSWNLAEPQWLTGSGRAYVVAKVSGHDPDGNPYQTAKVLEINSDDLRVREFYAVPPAKTEPVVDVSVSPTQPMAVLSVLCRDGAVQEKPLTMFLFGDMVRGSRSLGLTEDVNAIRIGWSEDGFRPIALREGPSIGSPKTQLMLDFMRGTASSMNPASLYAAKAAGPVRTSLDANGQLWMASSEGKSAILVYPDAESMTVSPSGTAVAFLSEGVAMVRPIVSMPARDYLALREGAERPLAESRAKRCYFLLGKYASSHEEHYPGRDEDSVSLLRELTDDPKDLDGFDYAFSGGKRSSISNPKNTLLATLITLTGKAYLYADGNVRWESNGLGVADSE